MREDEAASIILKPYITEKSFDSIEKNNKLVFIVKDDANKNTIKQALSILYEVKVKSINTARTIQGKKAYVTLSPDYSALDLANKLGVM
ncbi:MAG: 50S ribosomal protein L23 [Thaumarchaeota archaeon]|nr:50S ribosomal protein L23 [Nitrososphaerota archaeon]HIC76732.1 50S ribosomal protein L23 [Candidatus Dadabacteria bacterium]